MKHSNNNVSYLTVNGNDKLWGLYATTIGFQKIQAETSYPPKTHPSAYWFNPNSGRMLDEYTLLYITEGEGIFESSSCRPVNVNAGDLILLFPGEWHTYKPVLQVGWTEYWIGFNGNHIDQLISNNFFSKKNPVFNVGFNEQFATLYNQGIETARLQNSGYQQVLAGITSLLLSLVSYTRENNCLREKAIIAQIEKARIMMRENADNDINPIAIASSLHVSYSWFRRVFKQYTGFSPAQYQMEIKVQKAKEFLASTDISIKEIAFDLNFESVSYFVTFFKSKTGMSPTAYRTSIKGNG